MRALVVELTRLRWRRAVLLLLVASLLLPALMLLGTVWSSRPMSEADVDALLSDRYAQRELTRCEKRPEQYIGTVYEDGSTATGADPAQCRDLVAGWYGGRTPLDLRNELNDGMLAATTVVLLLLLLMGTTFVGHDWSTGSMSNQLLFEPRRGRVWLTKAAAVTLVGLVLATAVLTAYWAGLVAVAGSRDVVAPDGTLRDGFEQALRTGALGGALALGGYALTMLFRSTVATIGILFGVAVLSGAVLGALGPSMQRWQPVLNGAAVIVGDFSYYDDSDLSPDCFTGRPPDGLDCDGEQVVTAEDGTLFLGSLLVVVVAGSVVSFRRRDVP